MSTPQHVVIIGNGIAGITAARHIRRISEKKITVISAESDYFFSRTALMYVYMGHMKWEHLKPYEDWFWEENNIELKQAYVEKIEAPSKMLFLRGGEKMSYDQLILATGSVPRFLGWDGEELKGVQGLVSKQDLELLEENTRNCKSAVIVGGGLIGVELSEMLHTRNIPVTMLIREKAFWQNVLPLQDAQLISRHIESHGIVLKHETKLKKINGTNGRVSSITTTSGEEIDCDLLGISVGVKPNITFLKNSDIEIDQGILVDEYLQTNIPDIYAIGDCAQHRNPAKGRKPVEAVWYTARMMGETVAQTICEKPYRYKPGHWFNSAKFFDIEFQTYGNVRANPEKDEDHFHWEHKNGDQAITIAFDPATYKFLGINTFRIRMRHEIFDRWLTEERDLEYVLSHLRQANFDPEFYDRHEKEIFSSFKQSV
jgi:NAD(P)H-nitrite reductase large subunit